MVRDYIPEYGKRNHLRFINDLIAIFRDSFDKLVENNQKRTDVINTLSLTKNKIDALTRYLNQLPKTKSNQDATRILEQVQDDINKTRTNLTRIENTWTIILTNLGKGLATSEDIKTIVTESLEDIYPSGELVDDIRNELTRLETLLNELSTRQDHELDDD